MENVHFCENEQVVHLPRQECFSYQGAISTKIRRLALSHSLSGRRTGEAGNQVEFWNEMRQRECEQEWRGTHFLTEKENLPHAPKKEEEC